MPAPVVGFEEFTVSTWLTMAGGVGAGALLPLHPTRVKKRRIAIPVRLNPSLRIESAVALSVIADRCSRHRVVLVMLVERIVESSSRMSGGGVVGDKAIPSSQLE